jgi:predicted adenylyl cyclase CyaB
VADPTVLAETLGDTLGVRVVVEKARRLLMWRNVRIHVDRVAGLGDFVELEAVASTADGLDAERPRIDRLTDALGIDDPDLKLPYYRRVLGLIVMDCE